MKFTGLMKAMKDLLNNRRPVSVDFTDSDVVVTLNDGSKVGNPLNWHHWLEKATNEQGQKYEVYSSSIFWDDLDEGLDIEGMLRGIKPKQPHRIP